LPCVLQGGHDKGIVEEGARGIAQSKTWTVVECHRLEQRPGSA